MHTRTLKALLLVICILLSSCPLWNLDEVEVDDILPDEIVNIVNETSSLQTMNIREIVGAVIDQMGTNDFSLNAFAADSDDIISDIIDPPRVVYEGIITKNAAIGASILPMGFDVSDESIIEVKITAIEKAYIIQQRLIQSVVDEWMEKPLTAGCTQRFVPTSVERYKVQYRVYQKKGASIFGTAPQVKFGGSIYSSSSTYSEQRGLVFTKCVLRNDDSQSVYPGSIQLAIASTIVNEDVGVPFNVYVSRTSGSYGAVSVSYTTSGNTATQGSDYLSASGTLTWADGDTASKAISLTINDDSVYEGNETFTITLSNPAGGATLGGQSSTAVTIVENETPSYGTLQFSVASTTVNEDVGVPFNVYVSRTSGSYGAVSVSYATSGNTATQGSDYLSASGTLTWTDGDTASKAISLTINDDSAYEGNESFAVSLSNPTGGATLGGQSSTTVSIVENDSMSTFLLPSSHGFSRGNDWLWPERCYDISDITYAVSSVSSAGGSLESFEYFGAEIPSNATILGLEIRALASSSAPLTSSVYGSLRKGSFWTSDYYGSDRALDAQNIPVSPDKASIAVGGPHDLWGTTWTPADINSDSFALSLAAFTSSANAFSLYFYEIEVIIYYE